MRSDCRFPRFAVLITQFEPTPIGHGGAHRSYQILHDLQQTVGEENTLVVSLQTWQEQRRAQGQPGRWARLGAKIESAAQRIAENPLKLLTLRGGYGTRGLFPSAFGHDLDQVLCQAPRPAVCVVEHTGLAQVLPLARQYGMRTLVCPQNIESLDVGLIRLDSRRHAYARAIDFANELGVLARFDERLFISQSEASIVGGLGLSAHYYPYLPVGEIRARLLAIRALRSQRASQQGLFLMLGSARHVPTGEAFAWFVHQAQAQGLPSGIHVVVGGKGTERLLPPGTHVPGLEVKGFLEQSELDHWMATVQAVLIPQFRGFGALTRLPELACAGVPVLLSRHPSYAVQVPPGVEILEDRWEAWRDRLAAICVDDRIGLIPESDYTLWEQAQPRSMADCLAQSGFGPH
jgi:hypothetical protein